MTKSHPKQIVLRGVRVHNLKNIDLEIGLNRWTALVGVSGSGKSSLAFDTLYAEGQRRYIETFSTYARRFLDRLERPEADAIESIPPAIALRQQHASTGDRSAISTATDVFNSLRLLLTRAGKVICPQCDCEVRPDTPTSIAAAMSDIGRGTRIQIAFPLCAVEDSEKAETIEQARRRLRSLGFHRVIVDHQTIPIEDAEISFGDTWVVVDRLVAGQVTPERLADSLELAFRNGDRQVIVLSALDAGESDSVTVDDRGYQMLRFDGRWNCNRCGRQFLKPTPRLFQMRRERNFENPYEPFRSEALAVQVAGHSIADLLQFGIEQADSWLGESIELKSFQASKPIEIIIAELQARLRTLIELGLGYLTLDRPMSTLSRGESQRVRLAATIGTNLVNTLYVLDEPSIGLHPHDVQRVIPAVKKLRSQGNTVVVVEHERAFIEASDDVIELGPAAGREGGEVVFQGTPTELLQCHQSVTARNWRPTREKSTEEARLIVRQPVGWMTLSGAHRLHLKNLTVEFPLGVLCAVTGVSGSGKSTLVEYSLYPAVQKALNDGTDSIPTDDYDSLEGFESIDDVMLVDPTPIGRTPRSTPATYLKLFDAIRQVFAETNDAKIRNFSAGDFSFNSPRGGRCEKCRGIGSVTVDMQFLADVTITCPECRGARFRREILEVKYRGLNIAEVLELTARDAFTFFRTQRGLQAKLRALKEVGLDYLPLGQPATTLSGGESQRLKLASRLGAASSKRTLFLINEPTAGLHAVDVQTLLTCFDALLGVGHSLIVVEHDMNLIGAADWLIDLGPGAGERGGEIVATGTPEQIRNHPESLTGWYLREFTTA